MAATFFYRYKLHHLLFWILFFAGWYYFRYQDFDTKKEAFFQVLIRVLDLVFMVYIVNYLLIPKLLYKKKYGWFAISFFVLVSASSLFKIYLLQRLFFPSETFIFFDRNFKARVYDNVIPHFLLVSTGAAFKLLIDYAKAQRRIGEMAKEKAESELNFLKSQINPHFLFNSLNSVYFLIDKKNEDARKALHKFSEMLRFQLYEIKDQKIPVEKEIGFIRDYIDLQRLRHSENCSIKFDVDENMNGCYIEPLLLFPFVENAFKHLSHYGADKMNEINIGISREKDEINFTIKNTTEGKNNEIKDGGIGLSNVKRRLELLYPEKHTLHITEKNGWFDIVLEIKDHEARVKRS